MKRFGLLHHPKIPRSQTLAREAEAILTELGATVWHASAWDEEQVLRNAHESDLLLAFGGDGTIVRTARTTAGHELPILGVNLGRLGFLADVQPGELSRILPLVVEDRYWLEERLMLHAELERDARVASTFEAVNDVVVSRGQLARAVRVDTYIDDELLTQYAADGVIVATPTGSTAYSLAAGGPILDPRLHDMLLKPIAPHLTVAAALVVPATARVRLQLAVEYPASLSVDGQVHVPLQDGDAITVTGSSYKCRFAHLDGGGTFYRHLLARLRQQENGHGGQTRGAG